MGAAQGHAALTLAAAAVGALLEQMMGYKQEAPTVEKQGVSTSIDCKQTLRTNLVFRKGRGRVAEGNCEEAQTSGAAQAVKPSNRRPRRLVEPRALNLVGRPT